MGTSIEIPGLAGADAQALLEARASRYARPVHQAAVVVDTALQFERGDGRYGVPLTFLKEVRRLGDWCAFPGASSVVPGAVHFRGELLSLHDLAAFMGAEPPADAEWLIIVQTDTLRVGLLADELCEVSEVEDHRCSPVPLTLGASADCFSALYDHEVLLLDVVQLFAMPRFMDAF